MSTQWKVKPFKAVGRVVTGTTPSMKYDEYYGGDIPFVKPAQLGEMTPVCTSDTYLSKQGAEQANLIPQDSVMVCCIGSLGKVGIAGRQVATNQQINSITFDDNQVYPRYGFHYCRTLQPLLEHIAPSTTVAIVNKTRFENLEIPLPPLEEQRRIAAILDCADALRSKRRTALAKLDTLLQATFLDMFGDPVTNPKGWKFHQLSEYFSKEKEGTKCGPFGSALKREEYVDEGIPVWLMDNIQGMMFTPEGSLYITAQKYEQLKSYSAKNGDIIISRAGTVGKMCVVETHGSASIISTNLIRLSLDEASLDPYYFVSLMTFFKGRVGRLKTGDDGAYSFMNTGILNKLTIPIPPIYIQQQYRQILHKIRKQKEVHNRALVELDNLFHSLQQRAFRGQLSRQGDRIEQLRLFAS